MRNLGRPGHSASTKNEDGTFVQVLMEASNSEKEKITKFHLLLFKVFFFPECPGPKYMTAFQAKLHRFYIFVFQVSRLRLLQTANMPKMM